MYLFINVADISQAGTTPMGSPILWFVRPELGDKILSQGLYNPDRIDEMFIVIESSDDRIKAINDAIGLIGPIKLRRKIRTIVKSIFNYNSWISIPIQDDQLEQANNL